MYRNLYTIALGCSICLLVFGLGFLATSGGGGGRADFVWNNATEPQTLDPGIMSGQPEGALAEGLFEGLTNYHPKTLKPLPGVAESWESEGLTYTFHLRRDAWWVRGEEILEHEGKMRNVVAGDFVYSWRRMLHPETGAEYSYLLHLIQGAQEYEKIVGDHWTELIGRWNPKDGAEPARGSRVSIIKPESLLAKREDRGLQKELEGEYARLVELRDSAWERLVGVRARDDYTLEVVLKAPAPYFLDLTSFYPFCPTPREIIDEHGLEWILPENIVTNGPFYLLEWRFNSHIRMKKNVHYWEDADYAERRIRELRSRSAAELRGFERDQLQYLETAGPFVEKGFHLMDALAIEQDTTGLNLYLNGDVDRLRELPTAIGGDLLRYSQRPGDPLPHVHHGIYNAVYYYNLYLKLPIFREGPNGELGRQLRHALSLSIDRRKLIDVVTRQHQRPAYRLVPEGIEGYSEQPLFGTGDYDEDLREAKRLVRKVRAAGLSIPKLQILYNTKENHAKIAVFIQGIWKSELGIEVELANQEWGVFLDSRRSGNYQIARSGWIGDYADPNTFLDMFTQGNQNNDPKYVNPHYDRLVVDYCANILKHLESEDGRKKMLDDIRSGRSYAEAVHNVARPDGTRLGEALESALDEYGGLSGAARNDKASEIRLLLFEVAEAMLFHDMAVIPLYFYTSTQLWPPELEGYHINMRDIHPLKVLRWKGGRRPSGPRYDDFPRLRAELPGLRDDS